MSIERSYEFPVNTIEKITDGDTYWLHLDVGFRQSMLAHLRLNEWDTPELRRGSDYEKEQAKRAKKLVEGFMWNHLESEGLWVRTYKDPDSFGRWLADVWGYDSRGKVDLGQYLADMNLATPWPTRWREEYDTTT